MDGGIPQPEHCILTVGLSLDLTEEEWEQIYTHIRRGKCMFQHRDMDLKSSPDGMGPPWVTEDLSFSLTQMQGI